jgi:ligand-binding sensor domain-containing protein/two-component sensor histidine kinase
MRWLLTLAFVLFAVKIALTQSTIQFNHYTVEQGLSDNSVNDIIQDENGFAWIATANGLNRFDGVQFKNFFRSANNHAIPDNYIFKIRKWKNHSLVIATGNGIGILNTKNGQCQIVLISSQKEISRQTNSIEHLEVTSGNEIVVGSSTGVYALNERLQVVARVEAGYKPEDIGSRRFVFSGGINALSNGDVLAETTNGMFLYDHQRKIFVPLANHTNPLYREIAYHLIQHSHHIIGVDRHNRLFCIDYNEPRNHIIVYDLISGRSMVSDFPVKDIPWSTRIFFHNDSIFSINSGNSGFYMLRFDPVSFGVSVNSNKILPVYVGTILMLDKEQRWWAGTSEGLFTQSLVKQQFNNMDVTNYLDNKNSSEGIMDIYRYKKKLFVGLESIHGGILVFDENDRLLRKINLSSLHPGCNMIWNIEKWDEDTLVIGTQSGLVLLNTNNYHFIRIHYAGWPTPANESPVTIDYTDRRGTRWIGLGNTGGVLAFYTKTKTWKYFSPADKNAIFKLRYPTQMAQDKNGNIWMIHRGEGGLTRWNYQKQTFDTLVRRFDELNADDNDFGCLASDNEGNLWLYLYNHGILRWYPQKKQFQKYDFPSYWQNESVQEFYTGVPGQLWIIFRQSLSVMNLRTGAVKTFTKANGLPDYSSAEAKFYYDSLTQNLMLGFTNSFTRFNPREIFKKEDAKRIFITEINVLSDTLQADPTKTVRLKYAQNDLSIHFSAIDYENGHQNIYEYRLLENENSPWINIGHQQSINLNNLPPGKYIFQVRLSSPAITNNQQIASTTIIIIPPFYRRWWFYTLCILAAAAGFYVLYRIRVRQLIQVQQVRNRISSDLHDDIGSRLTNIQILSALSEQQLEQPEQASVYLHRIVNEVQTSGEALDDIVWSINSRNDSGEELAARMRRYAADIFEADHLQCDMHVNENISNVKLTMEKRRDLYLVFKEALNNILKHSQATIVNIKLLVQDNNVMMHIADNGKGFDINQPTNRNGLKNMKRRIQKWRGVVIIESAAEKGTTLHITLPVNEPSLKRTILNWMSLH